MHQFLPIQQRSNLLKSAQWLQLVLSLHHPITSMMFLTRWNTHWIVRIRLMTTTFCTITMPISIWIILVITPRRTKHFLKLIHPLQLVLSLHLPIINMMFHTRWNIHWIVRIKLMKMIFFIITIQIKTWIILETMHKAMNLSLRLTHIAQLVLSHHQRTINMMFLIKCLNHWSMRTKMTSMILETCTMQTNMLTLLENMFNCPIKPWLNQTIPYK